MSKTDIINKDEAHMVWTQVFLQGKDCLLIIFNISKKDQLNPPLSRVPCYGEFFTFLTINVRLIVSIDAEH